MRICLTGHTGFIGSELAAQLTSRGHQVQGLSRHDGGDVRDTWSVSAAAGGCDVIVHAAYAPVRAPSREILDVAVGGMTAVLRACEWHQVPGLLLVSSPLAAEVPGAYPDEAAAYGTGKLAAEAMAAAWARVGIPQRLVIARPYNVYGPGGGYDHVIPQFITRMIRLDREQPDGVIPFSIHGAPGTVRSFCCITDCAAQLASLTEGLAGRPPPATTLCDVGVSDARTIADVAHAVAACLGRQLVVVGDARGQLPGRRVPHLTIRPQVSFADGLARTVAWYREHEKEAPDE